MVDEEQGADRRLAELSATTYQRALALVSEMRRAAELHSSYLWASMMNDAADMLERVLESVYDGRNKEG